MIKLGRNYLLNIQVGLTTQEFIVIQPPFTLELDVTRNISSSQSSCKLRIYNLNESTRSKINFNSFNTSNYKQIILRAGYGDNLSLIFAGNISAAYSAREGSNFITTIECMDGGFAAVNGHVNISFPKGTAIKDVIANIMQFLPNVQLAAIGNFEGALPRDCTYSGNPVSILNTLTGGAFYVDNQQAYALRNNEYASSLPITKIDASSGLLNTPTLEGSTARFEMVFEPTLNNGALVQVESLTNPQLNGYWTITSVKHRGIISEVMSGDLITTATFFYSEQPQSVADYLNSISQLQGEAVYG